MLQETDTVSHKSQWGQLGEERALEETVAGPLRADCPSNMSSAVQSLDRMERCPHTRMALWTLDDISHSN